MIVACDKKTVSQDGAGVLQVADILNADSSGGFARVHRTKKFEFPDDHLAHPEYKHEWWYFTGNLSSQAGHRFGYQLTLFRFGLIPDSQEIYSSDYMSSSGSSKFHSSNWRANHFYMAHFAITDVSANKFSSYEKFSRKALGLAGAQALGSAKDSKGIKLWLDDWRVESQGDGVFPLKVTASKNDLKIDLLLKPEKPVVLHGFNGLSQKGKKQGNASFYYSITRLDTQGTLAANGTTYKVSGNSWYDREWSTSALEADQRGWDWFSLQLSDGRDIMFYKLRRKDGTSDEFSSGTLVGLGEQYRTLPAEDVVVEVKDYWVSPHSGIKYPSAWTLTIPKDQLELSIEPLVADQEHNLVFRYWEGAVKISGYQYKGNSNKKLTGYGYVELAGYQAPVQ